MIVLLAGTGFGAFVLSAILVVLFRPWLVQVALARPNARSSHRMPTPQGGGIAVVGATILAAGAALAATGSLRQAHGVVAVATIALAALGFRDDVRPMSAAARLVVQVLCVGAVVGSVEGWVDGAGWPTKLLLLAVATFAGVWWVNLVNFMDGIDWITVAETVPLTGAICLLGISGGVEPAVAVAAAALFGALLGFAPANRPPASLFLGDVGSLPVGLLTGWMLLELTRAPGGLTAAILLPLYYCTDATLTLGLRARRGERLTEAHRAHFYQRALDAGWSALAIDAHVFAANVGLALLAAASLRWPSGPTQAAALAAGAIIVTALLRSLAAARTPAA